jgi:hypothetical protein
VGLSSQRLFLAYFKRTTNPKRKYRIAPNIFPFEFLFSIIMATQNIVKSANPTKPNLSANGPAFSKINTIVEMIVSEI